MSPTELLFRGLPVVTIFIVAVLLLSYRTWIRVAGLLLVPDNHVAVVYKKFVLFGKNKELEQGRIVALHGEAGHPLWHLAVAVQHHVHAVRYRQELGRRPG